MKGILILAATLLGVILLAGSLGWVALSDNDQHTTVTIDKEEARRDTQAAVEKVKEATRTGVETVREAVDRNGTRPTDSPEGNRTPMIE